ncbi:hypothetical protein DH2020_019608 [Rehmannia glutinosa]|uniref:Molybdenum cofactor sulfurase middle domain-containing protein n=1 Tax=Rehmannia glutinosa TaxID=99300 RepID=A0ABR0WQ01_REHGL
MEEEGRGAVATVKSILVYPIKSCRGISLSEAPISSTGFRWDRQWLVVNPKGRAYTQRVEPKLALVQVELPNEAFSVDWQPNKHSYLGSKAYQLKKWRASQCGNGLDLRWMKELPPHTNYLGKHSRLVRFNDASEVRSVDPNYVRGYKVMFSDGYPFLLLSQVPTINQETAVGGSEPTETLMSFRSDRVLRSAKKNPQGKVYFGQNMVCNDSLIIGGNEKSIKVGDPVFVLKMVSSAADAAA